MVQKLVLRQPSYRHIYSLDSIEICRNDLQERMIEEMETLTLLRSIHFALMVCSKIWIGSNDGRNQELKLLHAAYDSAFGNAVVQNLFKAMDKNNDGKVDENELYAALKALGFSRLQEKQVKGFMKRAGGDEGYILLEQSMQKLPKTLRTNLVKLAKKNRGDLGFLL
ncbi:death-specific protein [Chaetoceros tenuissimus]|uniref:Death-specific protein n=1 Tax=Chaetoceros tenuissimus TaxID=426638 RepID=A0AAD3HGC1_9STRA|nr:death-specific protein [Chaetoceros tenuissimus]